ncbi:ankyrin repeat-containing domain protein [Trichoderma sp. SZMC 28012]
MSLNTRSHADYNVGWVCALPQEQTAAMAMLDERHESLSKPPTDTNAYTLGSIGQHNIVIACLPKGYAGSNSAATVATQMVQTFPSIKIGLLVGIGGGIPPKVRLGDVVVSAPDGQFPGVIQWDLGKSMEGGKFERTGSLNNPPNSLLSALGKLESKHELEGSMIPVILEKFKEAYPLAAKKYLNSTSLKDVLFKSDYLHVQGKPIEDNGIDDDIDEDGSGTSDDEEEEGCVSCDPSQIVRRKQRPMRVHYGLVASSNTAIEDAEFRDRLNKELGKKVLCVEMEAAGLMNSFPCIVIRGICDYADSHREKTWQKYAAAVAAAFAKELLGSVQSSDVEGERPIRDILNEVKDELNQINRGIKAGFRETKKDLDNLIEVQKVEKQNEALEWLSSIDSASMHHDYIKKCEPGTGQDLLNSEELQQWINVPRTMLFCPGIPGAGKTFQMAILIDYLSREFRHDDTIGLAFFYYRFDRQDTQKPEQLIANLIKQLGQYHQSSREKIQKFYEHHKKKGNRPLIKELVDLLQEITSLLSRAYVIIDALDECNDNDYSRTRLLDSLFAAQEKGLNICATSREFQVIKQRFEGALKWQVTPSTNDIFAFLDKRMAQLPEFVHGNILLQVEIKVCIKSAIEGMFLLAQMYIDSLVGKRSAASVRRALAGLNTHQKGTKNRSDALSEAYQKAMERIQQQKGDLATDAMSILAWVVKSRKPLPLGMLRLILAIDSEASKIDEDNFPTADHITQACAPLVVIESETRGARLAHYTIQEYFETSNDNWTEKFQKLIANTCMTYLSFPNIRSVFENKDDDEGNFHNYATEFWAYHTNEALSPQGLDVQRVIHFLNDRPNSDLWHDSLMQIDLARTNLSASTTNDLLQISEEVVEFHVAACLGLSGVVIELIKNGCDPDIRDKRNRSPLWWAAYNGHAGIVELLLEQNVDIEVKDTFSYRTPLNLAAKRGPISIVKLLLDKDADLEPGNRDETGSPINVPREVRSTLYSVNTKFRPYKIDTFVDNWWYLSPLALAVEEGHEEISALLLRRGAKIETKSDHGPAISALHVAITAGRDSIVKLLLTHGADIEMRDGKGSTALHVAVESDSDRTNLIKLLLSNKADIESRNNQGCTVLHFAAVNGQMSKVELLLSKGADINGRNDEGLTALHLATRRGKANIVKLLLSNGPEIRCQDKMGRTVLHLAAQVYGDRVDLVEVFLRHDADMEVRDKRGWTPLIIAANYDNPNVIKTLVAHGASVGIQDKEGYTALHVASSSRVVEVLLARGVGTEIRNKQGLTPLHTLATCSNPSAVEVLLSHGAGVEVRDNDGWTALHVAARNNNTSVATVLLTQGANIDAENEQGETALMIASRYGLQETIDLLIAQGAQQSEKSILSCAIITGDWPRAEPLIAKGVTIDEDAAICGGRMLHNVIDKGDVSLLDWLLQYNVDVNYYDKKANLNPLHRAVETGNVVIVSRLLEVDGIDAEAVTVKSGFNALTMALRKRNKEIAKLLINSGKLRTAFGRPEFLDFLKKHYA